MTTNSTRSLFENWSANSTSTSSTCSYDSWNLKYYSSAWHRQYDWSDLSPKRKESYEVLLSAVERKVLHRMYDPSTEKRDINILETDIDAYEIGEKIFIGKAHYVVWGHGYEMRRYPNGETKRVNKVFKE